MRYIYRLSALRVNWRAYVLVRLSCSVYQLLCLYHVRLLNERMSSSMHLQWNSKAKLLEISLRFLLLSPLMLEYGGYISYWDVPSFYLGTVITQFFVVYFLLNLTYPLSRDYRSAILPCPLIQLIVPILLCLVLDDLVYPCKLCISSPCYNKFKTSKLVLVYLCSNSNFITRLFHLGRHIHALFGLPSLTVVLFSVLFSSHLLVYSLPSSYSMA